MKKILPLLACLVFASFGEAVAQTYYRYYSPPAYRPPMQWQLPQQQPMITPYAGATPMYSNPQQFSAPFVYRPPVQQQWSPPPMQWQLPQQQPMITPYAGATPMYSNPQQFSAPFVYRPYRR